MMATAVAMAKTRPSGVIGRKSGTARPTDSIAVSTWLDHHASGSAAVSPHSASSRPSISNCWNRRARPAPSATRTAIWWWRAVARASSRAVKLMHPMANSVAVSPTSTTSEVRYRRRRPENPVASDSMVTRFDRSELCSAGESDDGNVAA